MVALERPNPDVDSAVTTSDTEELESGVEPPVDSIPLPWIGAGVSVHCPG